MDSLQALSFLDSVYKSNKYNKEDTRYKGILDSVKQRLIYLGYDPDFIAPKIVSKEDLLLEKLSKWDGAFIQLVNDVKQNMHDPDSFEHVSTKYIQNINDSAKFTILMEYRGKNTFNAKVKNSVACVIDVDQNTYEIIQ